MRNWQIWEINQLRKYGFETDQLEVYGEMPVEYITGKVVFARREFEVDRRVLIPRVETEELVAMAIDQTKKNNYQKILDVGTGSGVIGISVAAEVETEVTLADISFSALALAQQNARNILGRELTCFQSDIWSQIPGELTFDLVIANLPYIPSKNIDRLDKSVVEFEPRLALDGGADGTDLIDRLILQLPERLTDNGRAILEIDDSQGRDSFTWPSSLFPQLVQDLQKKNRFIVVTKRRQRV